MEAENIDWFNHMEQVMKKHGQTTTQKELKDAYSAWSSTYEKVRGVIEKRGPHKNMVYLYLLTINQSIADKYCVLGRISLV